jgi:Galactose oxidase, central domain
MSKRSDRAPASRLDEGRLTRRATIANMATAALAGAFAAGGARIGRRALAQATPRAGNGWMNAAPAGPVPLPRDAHAMADDAAAKRAMLFGGKGAGSRYLNDLWAYAPTSNAWSELKPAGALPPARFGHAMDYDSSSRATLVFGGAALGAGGQPAVANDLWAYDATANAWSPLSPGGTLPPARLYPSLISRPTTGDVVLFGGWDGSTAFDDAWRYDPAGNAWTMLAAAPPARWGAAMVLHAPSGMILLFGGLFGSYDGSRRRNDLWGLDPPTNLWKNLDPRGEAPPARAYAAAAYDAEADRVILFGGFAGGAGLLGDCWMYDLGTNRWTALESAAGTPAKRDFSAMVYDPGAKAAILFGGMTGETGNINGAELNDTWRCSSPRQARSGSGEDEGAPTCGPDPPRRDSGSGRGHEAGGAWGRALPMRRQG